MGGRGSTHARGRVAGLIIASLTVLLVALMPWPAAALAPSTFESSDGDLVAGSGQDWATAGITCPAAAGQSTPTCALDRTTGDGDTSLGQGSKDDNTTFTVVNDSIPPNKSDLTRFYVTSETVGSDEFLYFAWERTNTLGSANFSIEANQLVQSPPPASGPWALQRLANDILITFDFTQGGKSPQLYLYRWKTSGSPKTTCFASNTVPCWGKDRVNLTKAGFADGAVNTTTVIDPIAPDAPRSLPALTFGEAAVNLTKANAVDVCTGFGSVMVRSRSSATFNSELKDFAGPVTTSITAPVNVSNYRASGSATPAILNGTAVNPPGTVSSSRTGAGSQSNHNSAANIAFDHLLSASLLDATASSTVTATPPEAHQRSVATTLGANVANGTVTADVVSAVADANATDSTAHYSSLTSGFANLRVDSDGPNGPAAPVVMNDVAPNSTVPLVEPFFGKGSYVKLYEESGSVSAPPAGTPLRTPVAFDSNVTVTMIRVHITDNPLTTFVNEAADVVVSTASASAHSEGFLCNAVQEVSGHAFIAELPPATNPLLPPVSVGFVTIPSTGGHAHQGIDSFSSSSLTVGVAESDTQGGWTSSTSSASSYAQAANVCVLPSAGGCAVSATLVRSQANSSASASSRSSDASGTQLLGVTVMGMGPVVNPPPNTVITLPGIGVLVLNEQVCDSGTLASGCQGTDSTGITVRAIRLTLTNLAEIIVAEAHSDARYVSVS